jgi:hypothetical protein
MLCLFASSREILSEVECNFFTGSASVAPANEREARKYDSTKTSSHLDIANVPGGRDARGPSAEVCYLPQTRL